MPLYEPVVPYRYVAPLVEMLREWDESGLEDILAAASLERARPSPPDSPVPMATFDKLLILSSERMQRTDLGFEMGRRITIENHSPLGQALQRAVTLEEILLVIERYFHLVTPAFPLRYVPGKSHCEWRIRVAAPMSHNALGMFMEMHAVSVHVDLVRMFGADAIFDVYLSIPAPAHKARYERLPYTRFHFGAEALPEVRCVIPTELVRKRLPRPPRPLVPTGAAADRVSASSMQTAERYAQWVELMLREAQTLQPSVAHLAGLLNMSPRTLARRLSSEGINFRELSTAIRHTRACEMLADPSIAIHQIAYQLGYGDSTAFIRAFRRRSGVTPALYRKELG